MSSHGYPPADISAHGWNIPDSVLRNLSERPEIPGRQFHGGAEVRTVPSPTYPTLASALSSPGPTAADGSCSMPSLVVRVLPGTYHERLNITVAAIVLGAGEGLPTIRVPGPDGFRITTKDQCILRRLRVVAESSCRAIAVHDSSPLIENCELLGTGGDPPRGAPAGLEVRGSASRPVIRGCRISGHAGAGVSFGASATGLLAGCDISRCGCGVWIDGSADPLVWRNTIAGHRGAGIVVRAEGAGTSMGNAILRNGAGGILVESARRCRTVIAQNRVWANTGLDMRQSPASSKGPLASEAGVLLISNTVGQKQGDKDDGPNTALVTQWPKRTVFDAHELAQAVRDAPRDRAVLIELVGQIYLEETLTLDRPIVLCARERGGAELWAPDGAEAAVVIAPGGEASAVWWLVIRLQGNNSNHRQRLSANASCIDIHAGRPVIMECDLDASGPARSGSPGSPGRHGGQQVSRDRDVAARATGIGTSPLLLGCTMRGSTGVGVLVDRGGSAVMVQCEVYQNQKGGVYLGEGASVMMEGCEVRGNGHFGLVAGPHSRSAYAGRSSLVENFAGSAWICGGHMEIGDGGALLPPSPVWLDQCCLAGASSSRGPAAVVGGGAISVLWESSFTQQIDSDPVVRVEASGNAVVAMDGGKSGWSGWAHNGFASSPTPPEWGRMVGSGRTVWLDVSGAAPPTAGRRNFGGRRLTFEQFRAAVADLSLDTVQLEALWAKLPLPENEAHMPPTLRSAPASRQQSPASPLPIPPRLYAEDDIRRLAAQEAAAAASAAAEHWIPPSQRSPPPQHAKPPRSPNPQHAQAWGHGRGPSTPNTDFARPPMPDPLRRASTEPPPIQSVTSTMDEWEAAMAAVAAMEKKPAPPPPAPGPAEPPPVGSTGERIGEWLRSKVSDENDLLNTEANRRILYEILAMLAKKNKAQEMLDTVGLAGVLKPDDKTFVRGHTGLWFGVKGENQILCNKEDRLSACGFVIESKAKFLKQGSKISLRLADRPNERLGLLPTGEAVTTLEKGDSTKFAIEITGRSSDEIFSGIPFALVSMSSGKTLECAADIVQAKSAHIGTLQKIVMDKLPKESDIPAACADRELSVQEQAWCYRRGVQMALIDKQEIAKFLSNHKGGRPAVLKAYSILWEHEWRANRPSFGDGGDGSDRETGGRARAGTGGRSVSKVRGGALGKLSSMFTGISEDDKINGKLFSDALRSYFATAMRMSQLEADCVQRVIEAFAAAMVADQSFLDSFMQSLLPEKERRNVAYSTPEEAIFGLAYTTMMLNTDAHNQNVAQKMWDTKKFVQAGKDCGVTNGLMMQIYKCVTKEEL